MDCLVWFTNLWNAIGHRSNSASLAADSATLFALARKAALEAAEAANHLHNYERWIGPAASASGENHIADSLGHSGDTPLGVITSFQFTSGTNKDWGTAVQIWGATDSALILPAGRQAYFDIHRLRVTDVQTNTHDWLLRIICGATAAAGVTAGTFSDIPLFVENTNKTVHPIDPITQYHIAGTKMWGQLLHFSDNDAETMDVQFGIHGYPDPEA